VIEKTMLIKRTKEILSSIKSIGKSSKRLEQHTKPEFLEECGLTALMGRESSEVAVVTEALRTLETTSNSVIVDTLATLKDLVKDCDARNAALHFALENVKQESKRLLATSRQAEKSPTGTGAPKRKAQQRPGTSLSKDPRTSLGAFASSEALTEPLEAIAKMLQLSMGPLATANLIDTMKSATAEVKDSFGIDDMRVPFVFTLETEVGGGVGIAKVLGLYTNRFEEATATLREHMTRTESLSGLLQGPTSRMDAELIGELEDAEWYSSFLRDDAASDFKAELTATAGSMWIAMMKALTISDATANRPLSGLGGVITLPYPGEAYIITCHGTHNLLADMSASCRVVMKKGLYAFLLKHRQALWLPPNHGSIMIVPSPPIAPDYLVVGWHPVLNRALISRLGGNCDELVAAAKAQVEPLSDSAPVYKSLKLFLDW